MIKFLEPAKSHWECPSCGQQHVTLVSDRRTPLHQCHKHAGAWVPFLPAGMKGGIRVNERQDYIGTETPCVDGDGRIVQSVTTQREDGEDCHIFATTINYDLRCP